LHDHDIYKIRLIFGFSNTTPFQDDNLVDIILQDDRTNSKTLLEFDIPQGKRSGDTETKILDDGGQ
jgi:hypothetical protein